MKISKLGLYYAASSVVLAFCALFPMPTRAAEKCIVAAGQNPAHQATCEAMDKVACDKQLECVWYKEPTSPVVTTTPIKADSFTGNYLEAKYPVPDGYNGPLEKCAFAGTCRKVSDLIILLLNTMDFLFSIIGVIAFVAFIYGGFMMIFSFGSSEKVGHGKDAMVAAVVGLVIAFGAYMLISFILKALGVEADFRGITD